MQRSRAGALDRYRSTAIFIPKLFDFPDIQILLSTHAITAVVIRHVVSINIFLLLLFHVRRGGMVDAVS